MPDDEINESALQRKFAAVHVDLDELLKRIAEQAAAFSDDPAEQRDYRRTLLLLLFSNALRPLSAAGDVSRRRVDVVWETLSKELKETAARRKLIQGIDRRPGPGDRRRLRHMTDAELFNLHIEQLCRKHSILWRRDCSRQSQSRGVCDPAHDLAEIHTTPIRSAISYASALHEIGHALGRHRDSGAS